MAARPWGLMKSLPGTPGSRPASPPGTTTSRVRYAAAPRRWRRNTGIPPTEQSWRCGSDHDVRRRAGGELRQSSLQGRGGVRGQDRVALAGQMAIDRVIQAGCLWYLAERLTEIEIIDTVPGRDFTDRPAERVGRDSG